jgi:glycosyltransferase involved in cell wall biosynthesis
MTTSNIILFLVAPNVSTQMGGEAIKALQIFEQLHAVMGNVTQITHARNRAELQKHRLAADIRYVEDDWVDRFLWRSVCLRAFHTTWFSYRAVRLAEALAAKSQDGKHVIIHQTEPNSPVATRWTSSRHKNVFGPVNGNIYYPKAFRKFESMGTTIRRALHFPLQRLNRLFWRGIGNADLVLAAGGERTVRSLRAGGVPLSRIYETPDCGIPNSLSEVAHSPSQASIGRFIHFGRLVFHKGTYLAIEAVAKADKSVTLDIVGRGPELSRCKGLAKELGVEDRVRFLDWYEKRDELIGSFQNYCGMILPSIEDANGIAVQEAMAVGLVPVCLDWGGPQLLIDDGVSGYLVSADRADEIATRMACCLNLLVRDLNLATELSTNAKARASRWNWTQLAGDWVHCYLTLVEPAREAVEIDALTLVSTDDGTSSPIRTA